MVPTVTGNKNILIGLREYEEARWKEAIIHYLFGVWAGKLQPIIRFGDLILRLNPRGTYIAFGKGTDEHYPSHVHPIQCLDIEAPTRTEVEVGLARFVKDRKIELLEFHIGRSYVTFFKKQRNAQYGIHAYNLPALPGQP
jgi:hypothetical protein